MAEEATSTLCALCDWSFPTPRQYIRHLQSKCHKDMEEMHALTSQDVHSEPDIEWQLDTETPDSPHTVHYFSAGVPEGPLSDSEEPWPDLTSAIEECRPDDFLESDHGELFGTGCSYRLYRYSVKLLLLPAHFIVDSEGEQSIDKLIGLVQEADDEAERESVDHYKPFQSKVHVLLFLLVHCSRQLVSYEHTYI